MINAIVNIRVITPMFIGGADNKTAEFRLQSLKGLMRYWWRAANYGSPSIVGDLGKLRDKEAEIFGNASAESGRRSAFSLVPYNNGQPSIKPVRNELPTHNIPVEGKKFPINILDYLAYGVCEHSKDLKRMVPVREYFMPGSCFSFRIICREQTGYDVLQSLFFLSAFGGIGSKSHNGFGGFVIENPEELPEAFGLNKDSQTAFSLHPCKKMMGQSQNINKLPEITAFSSQTKIFRGEYLYDSWDKALAFLGKIYRESRLSLENRHSYNKRVYIGSPLIADKETHSFIERRTKPFFLKVIEESGKYRPYIVYIPAEFCSGLEKDEKGRVINHKQVDIQFGSICSEFNDHLLKNKELKEVK